MNRRIILAILVLVVVALGFVIFYESGYEIKKPSTGQNIIVFGDSLVEGWGSTAGNDLVSVISRQLNQPIINAGFSGDTTVSAMQRLNDDVLKENPKVVVIFLGGNDFLQRIPRDTTISNLRQMIQQIQSKGAGVVLVGIRKIIYSSDYKDLARETGSVYVPNILDETYGEKSLMSDQIHPNDEGYKIFAEKITPAIKILLE